MTLYPCLCGFRPETLGSLKKHRRSCSVWITRPNPKGLKSYRIKKTHQQGFLEGRLRCEVCGGRSHHHQSSCPFSGSEQARSDLVAEADINPQHWEWILLVLQKRYKS